MTAWLTCEHPGCSARVSPRSGHKCCQRHRPIVPQKPRTWTEEQQKRKVEADRKRRALAGLMPGFEGCE